MKFTFPPAPQPSVAIAESGERFPVRRIFCVGRNYAAHAREMGNDDRDPPFFFTKPADVVVGDGAVIPYPAATTDLHYEAELVVAIGKGGTNIAKAQALSHIWGYGVGIDLTRRDLQRAAKSAGKPWDMAKGFDSSAPCGAIHPASQVGHLASGRICLDVNGVIRQDADLSDMTWGVPEIIAALSGLVELAPGDLIYTGTPEGVGQIKSGDTITVAIDRLGSLTISLA